MSETGKIMYNGIIKWFNEKKGYGFIVPSEASNENAKIEDIFVHQSATNELLTEGDPVEYELTVSNKGKRALNVRKRAC